MGDSKPGVIVFGATGPTGTLVCQQLRSADVPVAAVLRSANRADEFRALGIEVYHADAMQPLTLAPILENSVDKYPIILNLLGGNPFTDPTGWPDYTGVANVTDAAVAAGYRRYVLVTTVGTGQSWQFVPDTEGFLTPIIQLKDKAEQHLKRTQLDWTIVKPGGLGPPDYHHQRGTPLLTENHGVRGLIDREDLADVIVQVLSADAQRVRHRELYAVVQQIEEHAGSAEPFHLSM